MRARQSVRGGAALAIAASGTRTLSARCELVLQATGVLRLVLRGQEQRERAPLSRGALDVDLAAEQASDLAADGKPEPGAAELPTRRAIRLLECFEDQLLLVLRDPDAGVAHDEGDHLLRAVELARGEPPPLVGPTHREPDRALLRELEGVRQQVLEHLLQPLAVGVNGSRRIRRHLDLEAQRLLLRNRTE